MRDLISLTCRFVNKMPNSVRSAPDQPRFVLLAALSPELLPFLETRPPLRASTSAAQPPVSPAPGSARQPPGERPRAARGGPSPRGFTLCVAPPLPEWAGGLPGPASPAARAEPSGRCGAAHRLALLLRPDSRSPEQGRAARPASERAPWPPRPSPRRARASRAAAICSAALNKSALGHGLLVWVCLFLSGGRAAWVSRREVQTLSGQAPDSRRDIRGVRGGGDTDLWTCVTSATLNREADCGPE